MSAARKTEDGDRNEDAIEAIVLLGAVRHGVTLERMKRASDAAFDEWLRWRRKR